MRNLILGLLAVAIASLVTLGVGYSNSLNDPVVRQAHVTVQKWPVGQRPLRVLALSDIHVAGPDMPPERLRRISSDLMTLRPDLIVISGDLVSEKRVATALYSAREILEAMQNLDAPLGVVIVPGNHDHWAGITPFVEEAERQGFTMLQNEAVLRGPFRIAGMDDGFSDHADLAKTMDALGALPDGVPVLVTHTPDVIPSLDGNFAAVFAGHTHCGQISLPLIGPISTFSLYGRRFACGDITDEGQRIFVGAGLGTSLLPLRFGVPPDVWLVSFGPED